MNWLGIFGLSVFCLVTVVTIGWIVIHRIDPSLCKYTGSLSNYNIRATISFVTGCIVIVGSPIWILVWITTLVIRAIRRSLYTPRSLE